MVNSTLQCMLPCQRGGESGEKRHRDQKEEKLVNPEDLVPFLDGAAFIDVFVAVDLGF